MRITGLRFCIVLVYILSFAVSDVRSQDLPEADEQEAAALAKQAAEQEIAKKAFPFVSGFSIEGLDPESPESSSLLVFDNGRLALVEGKSDFAEPEYSFTGNLDGEGESSFPGGTAARIVMLAIFKWIALSAIFGWPFVAFVLRGTVSVDDKYDPTFGGFFFRLTGWIANLLVLAVMIGLSLLVVRRPALWPGAPNVEMRHLAPLVGAMGVSLALSLLGSVVAWSRGYWRIPGRIHFTLTSISGLTFLWYLYRVDVLTALFQNHG